MLLKKKLLLPILFVFLQFTSTATAQIPVTRQIAPGVYFYWGDEMQQKSANCTWIVFKDFVVAIDANYPWGAEEILSEIRKTTPKPVKFVVNTHYHHDHTFGNAIFAEAGAAIISSSATAEEMRTLGQHEWDHGSDYSGRNMQGYKRQFPTITFDRELVFDDGEHRVELKRMGPAHTSGDVVAFLPKEKILVTGDLFVNGNPWGNNVADKNADYDKWLMVLDTLASWDIQQVIPGHGEIATAKSLRHQRNYLHEMQEKVRQGIKAGKSKERLIREIDLRHHPVYGDNKVSIARSIRDMYDRLKHSGKVNAE